jgi:hypothetical protein
MHSQTLEVFPISRNRLVSMIRLLEDMHVALELAHVWYYRLS